MIVGHLQGLPLCAADGLAERTKLLLEGSCDSALAGSFEV